MDYLYNLNKEMNKNESFSFTKEMKDFILKEFIVINDNPKIDHTNFNPEKMFCFNADVPVKTPLLICPYLNVSNFLVKLKIFINRSQHTLL